MSVKFSLLLLLLAAASAQSQTVVPNSTETENIKSIADSLFLNKNYENAILMYSKLLASDSKQQTALFNRGLSYYILKDNTNAVKDFSDLIAIDDKNCKAYYFRALSKFNSSSTSEFYDAETNSSACDDLFMARELGYKGDYSPFKLICPKL